MAWLSVGEGKLVSTIGGLLSIQKKPSGLEKETEIQEPGHRQRMIPLVSEAESADCGCGCDCCGKGGCY